MSEFQRSSLTIQPKQRLMSAGAFISPARTYDANEQMRIVESFRGLSAQSDALIDGFIKKKQEEAQAKADMYMTDALLDTNHPEHKKAKEMMNSLKPQAANLLGVDFWTQQYIYKAQAEQELKNEEYEMLEARQKLANLSPDEFREELGKIRAKTNERIASYPKGVSDYFYRMPRQQLTDKVRDEHYKGIMQEQLKARDTIFVNKTTSALDGLSDVVYNTPDLEDNTLDLVNYEDYENSIKDKATKEEIKKIALIYDWQGQKDDAGYFIPIDYKADVLQYRKLSQSPVVENVLLQMREYAAAGARPSEIKEKVYEAFTKFAIDNEDLGDEADVLFNIIIDRANKDTILQEEAGSWNYTNKTGKDYDIVLFDMADVTAKGKQLRQLALQSGNLKKAEYEAEQAELRQNVWEFLNDAELSGKLILSKYRYMSGDQIAEQVGLNKVEVGKIAEEWRQHRISSNDTPVTEADFYRYNEWVHMIDTGKVTTEEQVYQGYKNQQFHRRHYEPLLAKVKEGRVSPQQEKLINDLLINARRYVTTAYKDSVEKIEPTMVQIQNDITQAVRNGSFTEIVGGNNYLANLYKAYGLDYAQAGLNSTTPMHTPQTQQEFQEDVAKRMSEATVISEDKKTGKKKVTHQDWFNPYQTYDEWRAGQGQELKNQFPYMSETTLQQIYNEQQGYFENFKGDEKEKYFTKALNGEELDAEVFKVIWETRPDLVKERFGNKIELVVENGMPVPKDKHLKSVYNRALEDSGNNIVNAIDAVRTARLIRKINLRYLLDERE